MFPKDSPAKSDSRSAAPIAEASLSIIAAGVRLTGDIESTGVLKVDGEINGSITGARQVLLGRNGIVHGNVTAGEVVVGGAVEGSVAATERLELQATAAVQGDIATRSIVVLEGARINGLVRMGETAVRAEPLRIARG
ncbi:MAG: polymer-forming cytoskeletal protein [Gemmatimonadetes bacterium]|nr:polymer-forming cytoskeletal protein [Gemmatimonadota bacterium]